MIYDIADLYDQWQDGWHDDPSPSSWEWDWLIWEPVEEPDYFAEYLDSVIARDGFVTGQVVA